jgi:hypothetical protein
MMKVATYLASRREALFAIMPLVKDAYFCIEIFSRGWIALLLEAETLKKTARISFIYGYSISS